MANSLDILHIVAEASYMVQLVLLLLLFFSGLRALLKGLAIWN